MASRKKRSKKSHSGGMNRSSMVYIAGGIVLIILFLGFLGMRWLMGETVAVKNQKMPEVTLLTPPPPPPPEPEVEEEEKIEEEKPEEIIEEIPEPEPDTPPEAADEAPPDTGLGLDADGDGGGDAFGLQAKKGGKSIIGNPAGGGGDMQRFGWYIRRVEREIQEKIDRKVKQEGRPPKGDFRTVVDVYLTPNGTVRDFKIQKRTGNALLDASIEQTLSTMRISERPPEDMPSGFRINIRMRG